MGGGSRAGLSWGEQPPLEMLTGTSPSLWASVSPRAEERPGPDLQVPLRLTLAVPCWERGLQGSLQDLNLQGPVPCVQ